MNDEILEPLMNEKNEPCWLTRKYEMQSTGNIRTVKEIVKEDKPLTKIPIFNLQPQGQWRCLKCRGVFVSKDKPLVCECCDRESHFEVVTKIINPDFWKIPQWQEIPDTNGLYQDFYDIIKKCVIFIEDIQYKIYTLDIISSYFMDEWETIGFPAFIGMIESGKSRALDLIAETGWRMINAGSGVSFPAMVRGTHFYTAGILVDEAHDKLTPKTETGQQMIDFLKPGYRKGSHYIIADKEDPEKIISYNNFGFKGFAAERGFERAMMSRCKVYEMEQDYPEIQNLKDIRYKLNLIQTKLLNMKYRRTVPIPPIPADIEINGRNLEIFNPTIRTAMFLNIDYKDIVDYAKQRKEEEINSFKNTEEWDVLRNIFDLSCKGKLDAPEKIKYSDLIQNLDWEKIEGQQSPSQKLGYILSKKFQLTTKKEKGVTYLVLVDKKTDRKLDYLYKRYKVNE